MKKLLIVLSFMQVSFWTYDLLAANVAANNPPIVLTQGAQL